MARRHLGAAALLGVLVAASTSCGGDDATTAQTDPVATVPTTTVPAATEPPATEPVTSEPPVTAVPVTTEPVTSEPVATEPVVDCTDQSPTYLGHGLVAVVPEGAETRPGEQTDDAGPVHAEVGVVVAVGGDEVRIGRTVLAPEDPTAWIPSGGAYVAVDGGSTQLRTCVADTVRYDPTLDLLPDPTSDAPDAVDLDDRPVVAVDGAGDAVLLAEPAPVLLHEGWDLDDPPPNEGDVVVVDVVDITGDGATAWVGLCCEPVPGTTLRATPPTPATYDDAIGFGHAPTLSPDERYLATIDYAGITIRDWRVGDDVVGSASVDEMTGFVADLRWTGARTLAAVIPGEELTDVVAYEVVEGVPEEIARITVAEAGWGASARYVLSLAGWTVDPVDVGDAVGPDGHVLYLSGHDDDGTLLEAYHPVTLERVPDRDRTVSAGSTQVSITPLGGERLIGPERTLTVDGVAVDGEYLWAR